MAAAKRNFRKGDVIRYRACEIDGTDVWVFGVISRLAGVGRGGALVTVSVTAHTHPDGARYLTLGEPLTMPMTEIERAPEFVSGYAN